MEVKMLLSEMARERDMTLREVCLRAGLGRNAAYGENGLRLATLVKLLGTMKTAREFSLQEKKSLMELLGV